MSNDKRHDAEFRDLRSVCSRCGKAKGHWPKCEFARPASPTPEQPAQDGGNRCKHGIRAPWECKDCLYGEPSGSALAPPAQTQQGLSDGARADELEGALREIMACVNENSTRGLDAAMRMAEEALDLKPRPDKQPSPSAAPAQEMVDRLRGWLEKALRHQRESALQDPETILLINAALSGAPSRHVPGCTVSGSTCSCGYLNAVAGQPQPTQTMVMAAPAQEPESSEALRAAALEEAAQHFARPELDATNVICRHVAHFLRRLAAGEKMSFDPAANPPAASPEGALREALAEIVTHTSPNRMRGIAYAALAGQPARDKLDECACRAMTLGVSWSSVSLMNGDSHARDLCSDCQGKDLPRAAPSTTAQPAREDGQKAATCKETIRAGPSLSWWECGQRLQCPRHPAPEKGGDAFAEERQKPISDVREPASVTAGAALGNGVAPAYDQKALRAAALEEAAQECLLARTQDGVGLDAAYYAKRIRALAGSPAGRRE